MHTLHRVLPWIAVVAAGVACALTGVRVLTTEDLGYHLAYGGRFLETGRPVDHDDSLYTLPPVDLAPDKRPDPGPGCWYDEQGRYRFANANWLSQVIFAAAYRAGGVPALNVLLAVAVASLLALLAWLMHRLSVPPAAIAAALLVITVLGYQRFTLRPELLGYIVLAAQACILARAAGGPRRVLRRGGVAGLIGLQVLLVNLHGYFLLGLALTGAVLTGMLAARDLSPSERRTQVIPLAAALGGQLAACLVNPWTWRLAVLPVQTVLFLRGNHLADGLSEHPWSSMGDLARPTLFEPGWTGDVTALALLICVAVVAAGIAAAAQRRRWDRVLLMAGMMLVALSAQRNLAVGMLIAVPFAIGSLAAAPWWQGRRPPVVWRGVATAAPIVAAALLGLSIVTNGLYLAQDSPIRFGAGLSRLHLPVGAAQWIQEHGVTGRIWSTPTGSSTLSGLVEPRPALNMVSNTWVYPPAVMKRVLAATGSYGPVPFAPTADALGVSAVVARAGTLLRQLAADPDWVPVHVEGRFVVLVRRGGRDGALAERYALTSANLDAATLVEQARALDPAPGIALWLTGRVAGDLGWNDHAIELLAASRADNPRDPRAWIETANVLTRRAGSRLAGDRAAAVTDAEQAASALRRAWGLSGDPSLAVEAERLGTRVARLRSPAPAGPNVLLISIDTLRADHLGTYGYGRTTSPMLDRVAADGAVFENHISSTSWTLPAHAAIFSSLPDSVHGCTDTDRVLAEGVTTLAERFAAAGYDTAGFFAGPYLHPAFGLAQGFEHYQNCTSYAPLLDEAPKESWAMDVDVMRRSHRDVTNPTVTAAFTRWLRRPLRARFFAFVHLWDVHYDFVPPPPFDTMFDPDYDGPVTGENFFFDETINPDMPARDLEHLVALYDGEIAWTDAHLGRIIAELAATGRLDDTVIAVTSDHGTAFFEHGHKGHRLSLFDELIRVPLVIRYPPVIDPGTRIRTQTRAIDVAPTLLELAALPVPEEFMGESLVPLTGAGEHAFDHVAISELFSVGRRQRTARTNEWKLYDVMDQDKRFWTDLLRDPAERQLQAAGPGGGPAELAARYDEIAAILDQHARRRDPAGGPGDLPDDVRRQLRALGYVGAE